MKSKLHNLLHDELLRVFLQGVFAYIAMMAVILATVQIPPDAIRDTNMVQVLYIFDEDPLPVVGE